MNIIDLAKKTEWDNVKKSLKYHYGSMYATEGFEKAFNKILKMKPIKVDKKELIEIRVGSHLGKNWDSEDEFYSIHTNKYSMSFRKWNELSSIQIAKETLNHHTVNDILAYFIWEITFYGDEKKTAEYAKDLTKIYKKSVKEMKKYI